MVQLACFFMSSIPKLVERNKRSPLEDSQKCSGFSGRKPYITGIFPKINHALEAFLSGLKSLKNEKLVERL
ncbi:hypothetical protein CEXT_591561 [Caerostris extrusa]|uniref:Uncharacterized protein n=1 Tax=Caerostris extrusa TaxID=172846 RepID=A0AAV4VXV1_CAEEX|nr:hypothetical protein CEXT_591561 [Caerostris extrusa]